MFREFFTGVGILLKGFRMWRTHPRLMSLGLIPAVIAWTVLLAALIPLAFSLGGITEWMTSFAEDWGMWRGLLQGVIGVALFAAAIALASAVFTGLALTIGDPFYQRIWRGVERTLGGAEPTGDTGFWTGVGESIRLIVLGILVALLTLVVGFLPVVGGFVAFTLGVVLSGRLLARELTGRAFDARGLTTYTRSELLGAGRARVIGFGVATQLCFLVPLGAIVTMPAAIAGSTILARDLAARANVSGAAPLPEPPTPGVTTPAATTPEPPPPPVHTPPPHA